MKNPEMLKFVHDHFKILKLFNHAVKNLPFVIRYVPHRYTTQQMYDIATLGNGALLESVPDWYKNLCDAAVDNYTHALQLVPDCNMTQKMCDKMSIGILLQCSFFLNAIRLRKCVIKLLIDVF